MLSCLLKILWQSAIIFIVSQILGYVIHYTLLGNDYMALQHLYRVDPILWPMYTAGIVFAIGFVTLFHMISWSYTRSWVHKGIVFGFLVWLVSGLMGYLTYYAIMPLPGTLVLKQSAFDLVHMVILGLIMAKLNPITMCEMKETKVDTY